MRKVNSLTIPDKAVPVRFVGERASYRYMEIFQLRDGEPRRRVMPLDQLANKLTPTQL